MSEIADDPVARSLLQHLADVRGTDDPVGELARALISGEASPQELLRDSWFGEGLAGAVEAGQTELRRMSPEQLAMLEDGAARLHRDRGAGEGGATS
ncbi:hypothetical protein [Actinoplanes xinjiangensis]|uniref:Uncharacterized protein n=1 Tax=Actinoplanes xinjiangensis TaxID=512350 RepID=A0A316GCS2_9ACTN|nr:hypothetical protein [Actinoplanes xinjiangensis]PWK52397.1 hypothetical protein BC793_101406 [Actinoplanes xinjiangensis]GIF36903.1 hypothetical protein Axi01nite_12140 [Actinoplanes xinjiangensis]